MAVKSLAQSSVRQAPPVNTLLAGYQPNMFHHLETVRLGGTAATVSFTNLARYSDYQHFQVRIVGRTSSSSAYMGVRFNGDSAGNYSQHWLSGRGSGIVSEAEASVGAMNAYSLSQGTDTAGIFAGIVIDVLDPFEAKNKTIKMINARAGSTNAEINLVSGAWRSLSPVTSIDFMLPVAGTNFAAGSRFSLYGIKAKA